MRHCPHISDADENSLLSTTIKVPEQQAFNVSKKTVLNHHTMYQRVTSPASRSQEPFYEASTRRILQCLFENTQLYSRIEMPWNSFHALDVGRLFWSLWSVLEHRLSFSKPLTCPKVITVWNLNVEQLLQTLSFVSSRPLHSHTPNFHGLLTSTFMQPLKEYM